MPHTTVIDTSTGYVVISEDYGDYEHPDLLNAVAGGMQRQVLVAGMQGTPAYDVHLLHLAAINPADWQNLDAIQVALALGEKLGSIC